MIRIIAIVLLVSATFVGSVAMTQTDELGVDAELPGKSLKWIRIAEPEFARKGYDLDKYTIRVFEEDESIWVILRKADLPKTVRGGGGYEVEISKKTEKIISTSYSR